MFVEQKKKKKEWVREKDRKKGWKSVLIIGLDIWSVECSFDSIWFRFLFLIVVVFLIHDDDDDDGNVGGGGGHWYFVIKY